MASAAADFHVLGIKPTASLLDVRAAYKAKALQYHPDRATGNAEMFKLVQKAYNGLQARIERGEDVATMLMATNAAARGSRATNTAAASGRGEQADLAATWSGLGTEGGSSYPTSNAAAAHGGRTRSFTGIHAQTMGTRTASAGVGTRPRSGTTTMPATKSNASFMAPTASSKGASGPKVARHAPSTAPSKPSTLGSVHAGASATRRGGGGDAAGSSLSSSSSGTAFIKHVGLAVEFQKADLTRVVLDVSPSAFAMVGGGHLRFKCKVVRRVDGMVGTMAGVSPATGALYWHKDGSTYVTVAGGAAGDYCVTAPPPSPSPTSATQSPPPQKSKAESTVSTACMSTPSSTPTSPTRDACPTYTYNTNTFNNPTSACSSSYGVTPSSAASSPLKGGGGAPSSSGTFSSAYANAPTTPSPATPCSGASSSSTAGPRYVDPFAVTDSSNTVYFSSPNDRRTRTVSGVFGMLGGGGGGAGARGTATRVDHNVVHSRAPPVLSSQNLHTNYTSYAGNFAAASSSSASLLNSGPFMPFGSNSSSSGGNYNSYAKGGGAAPTSSSSATPTPAGSRPATPTPPHTPLPYDIGSAYAGHNNKGGGGGVGGAQPDAADSLEGSSSVGSYCGGAAPALSNTTTTARMPLRFPVTAAPTVKFASGRQ